MAQLKVLITSGGTISRIDNVRHIDNFSNGKTGALIAEEFLKNGDLVYFLHRKSSTEPFKRNLPDLSQSIEEEQEKLRQVHSEFNKYKPQLKEYSFQTFEDYFNSLQRLLKSENPDVVVLAAAVSDYSAKPQDGKISSDLETLNIEMKRNPKVISLVKTWNPKVFQVGFKLLVNSSLEELIDTAYKHGTKNHSNLTVANSLSGSRLDKTLLITPEKSIHSIERKDLQSKLVELVHQRVSKQHYSTNKDNNLDYQEKYSKEIDEFRKSTQKLYSLDLFEPYTKDSQAQFGFLAVKLDKGFLITARASNKKEISQEDTVYVEKVDFRTRRVYVNSSGKKASLNANLAAKIFETTDAKIVLHSHISLGLKNKTEVDYSPGTQEDLDEVIKHLSSPLELVNHGILIFGKDLQEIISQFPDSPCYTNFPRYYDLVYRRFQKSDDFLNLVSNSIEKDRKVLDLAGGTGDLSQRLLERGYKNISLADKNPGMLKVAEKLNLPTHTGTMENLNLDKKFDSILVRQAINYLQDYETLVQGLRSMYHHLNPGGRLIFNAPNSPQDYQKEKNYEYEADGLKVKIEEMNLIEEKTLIHTQRCTLLSPNGVKKLYDMNKFALFTRDDFEKALNEAGFSKISFLGKNLQELDEKSKSLYCLAER
jgi:phosphopantothenate---cysteine ligase (CTP)